MCLLRQSAVNKLNVHTKVISFDVNLSKINIDFVSKQVKLNIYNRRLRF